MNIAPTTKLRIVNGAELNNGGGGGGAPEKIKLGTLDHNEQIAVSMDPLRRNADSDPQLHLTLNMPKVTAPTLIGRDGHFSEGLKIYADGEPLTTQVIRPDKTRFTVDAAIPPGAKEITLRLYGEPLVTLQQNKEDLTYDAAKSYERLTATELRLLGTSIVHPPNVPASRKLFKGFDPEKHAPITDLHTHSSAQISNDQLMQMALDAHLDYPVELLSRLNDPIMPEDLTDDEKSAIKIQGGMGMDFKPLQHEGLDCETSNRPCDVIPLSALNAEHRAKLTRQMNIPQDLTMCFGEFDRKYYRFVNPIVKNPAMARALIMTIGENYARHGIKYAELSTASMLNLNKDGQAQWFQEMIKASEEVQQKHGVTLRYLIGIPRTHSPHKVMVELEKIKYAARHPLIAGVDLLGYESNKVEDFKSALTHIAMWAKESTGRPDPARPDSYLDPKHKWDFRRDFTIRVHAGETNKNYGNVNAAVKIAEEHGVQVRIAHALNELNDPMMDKAIARLSGRRPPLVSMEFCPDSNIAYNNIRSLDAMPFKRWLSVCKSWFLGTDGIGAIQTTPTQLALSALSAGVGLNQLAEMRAHEEQFVKDKAKAFEEKTKAFNTHYKGIDSQQSPDETFLKGMAAHIKDVTNVERHTLRNPQLPPEFDGKMPVLVAGAASDSIGDMKPQTRQEVERSMRMLVATLDPKKTFFVLGRTKPVGVLAAFDKAIMEHNAANPTDKFSVLGLTTGGNRENALSISFALDLGGDKDTVPERTIEFMQHYGQKGLAVFFGGKTYTSDMIKGCFHSCVNEAKDGAHNIPFLVMETADGATKAWAPSLPSKYKFSNAMTLISRMRETFRDALNDRNAFRDDLDPFDHAALDQLVPAAPIDSFQEHSLSYETPLSSTLSHSKPGNMVVKVQQARPTTKPRGEIISPLDDSRLRLTFGPHDKLR